MFQRQSWRASALLGSLVIASASACRAGAPPAENSRDTARETAAGATAAAVSRADVVPGLEVLLRDSAHLVRGKRVGFITNQTAVTSSGESGIDLLYQSPQINLVALFGPEHGLRGTEQDGVIIESGRDAKTGLPIFSLYGKTQRPTPEMLKGVDILLFDMQDIGARPYTFVWTMAMAMEAAAAQKIPFVVLDRPNPITGRMEGPLMQMEMRTVGQPITGYFPVPLRHGMTVGEIARYVNEEFDIGANLTVVPAAGWRDQEWFDETGLPWVRPSPNIPSLDAALNYAGIVLVEGTNLAVGRGSDAPMSYVAAPWLDAGALLQRLGNYDMPGVEFDTASYVPTLSIYRGEKVRAIRLNITDREAYRPVWTTLVLLSEIKRQHPGDFRVANEGFTQMLGSRWAREAFDRGEDPRVIWQRWEQELAEWAGVRNKYRMYAK